MRRRAYDSDSLPINWKRYQYVQGTRDYAFVKKIETFNSSKAISDVIANTPLKNLIDDYLLNDNNIKQQSGAGTLVVSGDSALIPLDVERYAKENNVPDSILNPQVRIPISKTVYYKHELMILEMLARSEWTRPIYFSTTVGSDYYMSLENNFQLEGLAYRIVPYRSKNGSFINTDIMYDKIMNDFRWGGMDKNPDMYLDETCRRMCSTLRSTFNQLASELIAEGKTEKAQKVLQKCIEVIPYSVAPYEIIMLYVADNFYKCNFMYYLTYLLNEKEAKFTGNVPFGKIMVDGLGVGDVGNIVLRDRQHLSQDGLIIVVITMDSATGEVVAGPDIISRGFVYVRESENLMDDVKLLISAELEICVEKGITDWTTIKSTIRDNLRDYIYQKTKRNPMILPIIMEV